MIILNVFYLENIIICIVNDAEKTFSTRGRSFIHLNDFYILNRSYGNNNVAITPNQAFCLVCNT